MKEYPCYKCGEKIPSYTPKCPHCDLKDPHAEIKKRWMIINSVVFGSIITVVILFAFNAFDSWEQDLFPPDDSKATSPESSLTEAPASSPSQSSTPIRQESPAPDHEILSTRDVSFGSVKRIEARVRVPKHYSKTEVEQISRAVTAEVTRTQSVNAIMIYIHGPNAPTTGIPNVARVVWAPDGLWSSADKDRTGDYSRFQYSVNYTPPVATPTSTSSNLTRSSTRGLLNVPLPAGARRTSRKPATADADPEETYQIEATGTQIIEFYQREMGKDGWSVAGWGNTTYEKVFEKGRVTMVIMTTSGGKTFTLWGSSG